MTFDKNKLESSQEYSRQGNFGHKRLEPIDRDDNETICPECEGIKPWDQGFCDDCLRAFKEQDEIDEERKL